jgi:hypothetical protein
MNRDGVIKPMSNLSNKTKCDQFYTAIIVTNFGHI